ncbi:MAG TPA: hypothetical protein VMU70_01940 [Candidatus Tyrphobacter sp.]|nr:hypothetical protein [Candidatus Tyrphobacter sp.]
MVYYHSLKKKRQSRQKKLLFLAAAFLVFLAGLGLIRLIVFSRLFELTSIFVTSNPNLPRAEVIASLEPLLLDKSKFDKYLGLQNVWVWGLNQNIKDSFLKEVPLAADLTVNRSFFHRSVTVSVEERSKTFLWCEAKSQTCFWVDDNGVIFEPADLSSASSSDYLISDSTGRPLKILAQALPQNFFQNLRSDFAFLKELNIQPREAEISDLNYREFAVKTVDGKTVYFSLTFNPILDATAVQNFIKSGVWAKLSYLDLRIEDRIYYR